jgi:hypothetical protein
MARTCFPPFAILRPGLAVVVLSIILVGAAAAADRVVISPQEAWSGVLGGRETTFSYHVTAPQDLRGRLGWSLSVDQRTLARGETALTVPAGQPGRTAIRFTVPEAKPGAVLQARLSVEVYDSAGGGRLAGHERTLWIFPGDPFALRSDWLKTLKITLFDPPGDTQKTLERAKIPFQQIRNLAALQDLTGGVLVVGQGISLEEYRALPEALVRLAAAGVPVVWLAPSAGSLPVPGIEGAETGLPTAKSVTLRRQEAITSLDKRLDADGWPPDGKLIASTISIVADRRRVMGRVGREANGWSWIEVHYPKQDAMLLICGFGIIDHWDAGPTPRWLFARMLEYVAPPSGTTQ